MAAGPPDTSSLSSAPRAALTHPSSRSRSSERGHPAENKARSDEKVIVQETKQGQMGRVILQKTRSDGKGHPAENKTKSGERGHPADNKTRSSERGHPASKKTTRSDANEQTVKTCEGTFRYTVFDLITAPALITAPPRLFTLLSLINAHLTIFFLTFYFIFTYYRPLDDLLALVVENKFT